MINWLFRKFFLDPCMLCNKTLDSRYILIVEKQTGFRCRMHRACWEAELKKLSDSVEQEIEDYKKTEVESPWNE